MSKRKTKLRLRYEVKIAIIVIIFIIIGSIYGITEYKKYLYHQTYEYKLLERGYSKEEVSIILEKLDDEYINTLLESNYNENIYTFLNEKYYLRKNLDRYLNYYKKNKDVSPTKVVALINTNRDYDYYENVKETDTSKGDLLLVNKYYYLNEKYVPNDLTNVSASYAYEGNSCSKEVLDAFIEMANVAREQDIVLIINSSYRSFDDQKETWDYRKLASGKEKADQYVARAGFSEHQSGLALDINQFNTKEDDFENTEAFKWLTDNAYKYGFILRYTKDGEDITGYSYESWHYRYVGVDIATKIYQENITFDEYYAYYIENK